MGPGLSANAGGPGRYFFAGIQMAETYTLDRLLQQLMQSINTAYRSGEMQTYGFVAGPLKDAESGKKYFCVVIPSKKSVTSLPELRRFARRVQAGIKATSAEEAGVVCTLALSFDGAPPQNMVALYADQKYGGMRFLVAPLQGEDLVFRDLGIAHPTVTFLPALFAVADYLEPGMEA